MQAMGNNNIMIDLNKIFTFYNNQGNNVCCWTATIGIYDVYLWIGHRDNEPRSVPEDKTTKPNDCEFVSGRVEHIDSFTGRPNMISLFGYDLSQYIFPNYHPLTNEGYLIPIDIVRDMVGKLMKRAGINFMPDDAGDGE